MEKGVKVAFLLALLILSTGFAYAGTKVTIKTLQYHPIEVIVADGTIKDYAKIGEFEGDANEYGDFSFNIETSKSLVNLYVHVKSPSNYSDEIIFERIMEQPTGKPLYFNMTYEDYELIPTPKTTANKTNAGVENATLIESNETETANATNLEEISDSFLTGSAIGDFFTSKTFYYSAGVVIVLVILFFTIRVIRRRKSREGNPQQEIKVRKMSEIQQESRGSIEDAEKKIKEAQDELRRLKNEEQIKAMRRKIAEDESELIKLRRSSGFG